MPDAPASQQPTENPFGQYQLIEKIAQGGMAEIFKGKALDLHGIERPVVIKRILPHIAASPEFVEMLIDEAKIAVMLSHGNIAQVYDLGKVAEDYFIVMEYVEGKTLSQIMKRLRTKGQFISLTQAAYLCAEVANGLDYMHRKTDENGSPLHIVHRDISPQNIILSTAGTVKIIDFGIAKAKIKLSNTDSGVLKGKFSYMSPEHAEGQKLDHRNDIFSLGVILFELLTGQRLFKGKNNLETIKRVKKTRVTTPSDFRPEIPKALDQIVLKALKQDRNKRYQSAGDLAQDLTRFWISHDPNFSPRELITLLTDTFSEPPTEDPLLQERTQISKATDDPDDLQEATVGADGDVIQSKVEEAEAFHVAGKKQDSLKNPPASTPLIDLSEEGTVYLRTWPRFLPAILIVGILASLGSGFLIYRHYHFKKIKTEASIPPGAISPQVREIQKFLEIQKQNQELKPPSLPTIPPSLHFGSLLVESNPPGAKVFLNDKESNQKTPFTFDHLPDGKLQKVGLYLDRYRYWNGEASIEGGKTAKLLAALDINYGDLQITSLPSDAQVLLNGKYVGTTPYNLAHLEPETTYEVLISKDGYEEWRRPIKIFGGKREVISASLKKIPPE